MFVNDGVQSSLIQIHEGLRIIPGLPYKWDTERRQIKIDYKHQLNWKLWLAIIVGLVAINAGILWKYWKQKDIAHSSIVVVSLACIIVTTIILWFFAAEAETCVQFFNALFDLEKGEKSRKKRKCSGSTVVLCRIFALTNTFGPWIIGMAGGMAPCSPPNLVIPLNPLCWLKIEEKTKLSLVLRTAEFFSVSAINIAAWKAITGLGCTFTTHILLGFDAQCTLLKESKFEPRNYRKIQLLNKLFNDAYVGCLFAMLAGCSVSITVFAYLLVKTGMNDAPIPLPVTIWTLIGMVDVPIIIMYIYGMAGSVLSLSKKVLEKEMEACGQKRVAGIRWKVLKSCPPISISFGISNYIEKDTPLKFVEFAILRFVDLLLID